MKTRIQKWGNSLAVRIPKSFAEELGWGEKSPVAMSPDDGALVIRTDKERTWDLDTLMSGVTGENVHPAWEAEPVSAADPEKAAEDGR